MGRSNRFGIPEKSLEKIRTRDKYCVYCGKNMVRPSKYSKRKEWATIEHIINRPPWADPSNVVICCFSCNSSKGTKLLNTWLESNYCQENNITKNSVSKAVRSHLNKKNH